MDTLPSHDQETSLPELIGDVRYDTILSRSRLTVNHPITAGFLGGRALKCRVFVVRARKISGTISSRDRSLISAFSAVAEMLSG